MVPANEHTQHLTRNLQDNIDHVRHLLNAPDDLVTRLLTIGGTTRTCAIVCLDSMVDKTLIHEHMIHNIQYGSRPAPDHANSPDAGAPDHANSFDAGAPDHANSFDAGASDFLSFVMSRLSTLQSQRTSEWRAVFQGILSGSAAIFVEDQHQAILVSAPKQSGRTVEEPATEALVRGPREGFTEDISTNILLIRKGIRDINLKLDRYTIGRRSRKSLVVAYIQGIIHPDILAELQRRLNTLDIDDAPESGIVEQWIEDSFLSPFPQLLHTERPDKVRAALLQGKAAIMLDGTPFALILPTTFVSLIQSPEDYYERWTIGSLIRMLRYGAVFISLFFPALYIALVSFHQGMIPFNLAFSIAAAREGVPFPAVIEALLMEGTLELLREAGIRLPKPIGQTIGIVGGLVIGEAAVQAGVVSPIMVIVVAVTAIASFAIPSYSAGIAFRMLRFANMLAASFIGLFGIILSFIMICLHLIRLSSFGVPYSAPFAPMFPDDWKDLFIRAPITLLTKRPIYMQTKNVNRTNK